jgi:nucleoside-diphosphate-sugar epimerase
LTYVENCAEAVVRAAEYVAASGPGEWVWNVVDDDPPTAGHYASLVRSRVSRPPLVSVSLPRRAVRAVGVAAFRVAGCRAPGVLVPERFDARFKPLEYPNGRIKAALGWRSRYTLDEALERCQRPETELLALSTNLDASSR